MKLHLIYVAVYYLFITQNINSQKLIWSRVSNEPRNNIHELIFDNRGQIYSNLKNRSNIYLFNESETKFEEINYIKEQFNGNNGSLTLYRNYEDSISLIYCICPFVYYKLDQAGFIKDLEFKSPFNYPTVIIYDSVRNAYTLQLSKIYVLDSSYKIDSSFKALEFSDLIQSTYFYNELKNYIITKRTMLGPINDTFFIYKFNRNEKSINKIVSVPSKRRKESLFVTKEGRLIIADYVHGLLVSKTDSMNRFDTIKFNYNNLPENPYYIGLSKINKLFILTDGGVYFQNSSDYLNWIRLSKLSNNLPEIISNIQIYDSTRAFLISPKDCNLNYPYIFLPQYENWNVVDRFHDYTTLSNVLQDSLGNFYSSQDCSYYKSGEDKSSWSNFHVYSKNIELLCMNSDKIPIALADHKIYKYNLKKDQWLESNFVAPSLVNINYTNLYLSNNILFLEAFVDLSSNIKDYLFASINGGFDWFKISPIKNSNRGISDSKSIKYSDNSELIAYDFLNEKIVVSNDYGSSWKNDNRIMGFRYVRYIDKLNDSTYLVTGNYSNKSGIYKVGLNGKIEEINEYFRGVVDFLIFQSPNILFGKLNSSAFPFISYDLGKTIIEIDRGLINHGGDRLNYEGIYLDNNLNGIASIKYNGIFTCNLNIKNNILPINKIKEEINILYSSNNLIVHVPENLNESYNLIIYSLDGKVVETFTNLLGNTIVPFNHLTGLYFSVINTNSKVKFAKAFYKN